MAFALVTGAMVVGLLGLPSSARAATGWGDVVRREIATVVDSVKEVAGGYADVSADEDGLAWRVTITKDDEPVLRAATQIVMPVVAAVQDAGATSATTGDTTLELGDVLPNRLAAFASFVLGGAEATDGRMDGQTVLGDASNGGDEIYVGDGGDEGDGTLASLVGRTARFAARKGQESVTFSFAFTRAETEVAVYRLYNPFDEVHLYTTDAREVTELCSRGWVADFGGEPAWYAPLAGSGAASYEVIRLYNPFSHDHYYVKGDDVEQIDELTGRGWRKDGPGSSIWSAADGPGTVAVRTLFNPHGTTDTHLWTTSQDEVDGLVDAGWVVEATTFRGVAGRG